MKILVDSAVFGLVPIPVACTWRIWDDDRMSTQRLVDHFNVATEEVPSRAQDRQRVGGEGACRAYCRTLASSS